MKRDMTIIRSLLLDIEQEFEEEPISLEVTDDDDYTQEQLHYHLKLMGEAKLIQIDVLDEDGEEEIFIEGMTWEGHDFLDSIKSEPVWSKLKRELNKQQGTLPFSVLKKLAVKLSEKQFTSD